jgi:mRNA interferase RelE/StbE
VEIRYTSKFIKSYTDAPLSVRKAFDKQSKFLLDNLRHPSLRSKKYDESRDLWQARVNSDWRFYFTIEGGAIYLYDIIRHPK